MGKGYWAFYRTCGVLFMVKIRVCDHLIPSMGGHTLGKVLVRIPLAFNAS